MRNAICRLLVLVFGVCLLISGGSAAAQPTSLKAGFIYVGPVGDYGFSHAHDLGRKYAQAQLPWLETVFIESVAEADVSRIIDRLVQEQKCDVVFTTSFGYMDSTIAAGNIFRGSISGLLLERDDGRRAHKK